MIAQAVFSKEQSIQHCLNEQSKAELERKKNEVAKNRTILARIVHGCLLSLNAWKESPTPQNIEMVA